MIPVEQQHPLKRLTAGILRARVRFVRAFEPRWLTPPPVKERIATATHAAGCFATKGYSVSPHTSPSGGLASIKTSIPCAFGVRLLRRLRTNDLLASMIQYVCPNGLRVWQSDGGDADTRFVYRETFDDHCYERHGVTVRDGDVVVDVGAHIGLFAMSIMGRFAALKVVCFEPAPATRECLVRNLEEFPHRDGHRVTVIPTALGAAQGIATISYLPRMASNSTLHFEEKQREWSTIVHSIAPGKLWRSNKLLACAMVLCGPFRKQIYAWFVDPVFAQAVQIPCEVKTLSDAIRELRLERVDLLKIDVEGSELDVLAGLDNQHWPLIRQLAMEVAPSHKAALVDLERRLRNLGFVRIAVESPLGGTLVQNDPMPCTLYAVR